MKGHVRRKDGSWAYSVTLGRMPAQQCESDSCAKRFIRGGREVVERPMFWIERGKRRAACPRCGGALLDIKRRRDQWKGGFRTQKAAETAMAEALTAINNNTYVPRSDATVAGYFDAWFARARSELERTTADGYLNCFDRYVREDSVGRTPIQSLKPVALSDLYGRLLESGGRKDKPLSPNTVRHVHVLLHSMLKSAVKADELTRNVADFAEAPKQRIDERGIWNPPVVESFVRSSADHRLGVLWRLLALYGPRRGEALGIRWDDLDLEAGTWTVSRSLTVVNGSPHMKPSPKTRNGRRTIQFDPETVTALKHHKTKQVAERLRAGADWTDNGLVFCQPNGKPLHPNLVTRSFLRLTKRLQLPRITVHDVRHSAIVRMLYLGVAVKTVSEIAGHASVAFTLDRYGHVIPAMREDAAAVIGGGL